jgi:hypothetical protein
MLGWVGLLSAQGPLYTPAQSYTSTDHTVASVVFHWYTLGGGQQGSAWAPLEGRTSWTGEPDFWQRQLKDIMDSNIDIIYVHLFDGSFEQQRINLFTAYNQLRSQGYDVPKASPFLDPKIIWKNTSVNVATEAGKDEFVSHYIRWFNQYFGENTDPDAVTYLAQIDNKIILNTWHAASPEVLNITSLTRNDVESRLAAEFGGTYPVFNNGVYMIFTPGYTAPSWIDEKQYQFSVNEHFRDYTYNNKRTAGLKPGFWNENLFNPGTFLPRDGGTNYINAWLTLLNTMNNSPRIYHTNIESWNEYGESSGLYEADPGPPIYISPPNPGTNTDVWSNTDNPREYIDSTATYAAQFNDRLTRDAQFLQHTIPATWNAGQTLDVELIVRNQGDNAWSAADDYKLGLMGPKVEEFTFDSDAEGWILVQNPFGTGGNTAYENGEWNAAYGYTGGGLKTQTGNVDSSDYSNGASTAWSKTFYVDTTKNILIKFKYRLLITASYESDERGEARFELDNQAYGNGGQVYLAQFTGSKGYDQDTGWEEYSRTFNLAGPANHTIEIGGYNNKKTQTAEFVDVHLDDVEIFEVDTGSPFGPGRYLMDDAQDEIPKYSGLFRGRPTTFNIQLTAPTTPGTYDLNFRMVQEFIAWFGEVLNLEVEVVPAAHTPSPANTATEIDPRTLLSWSAGPGVVRHHVYLGTDELAVTNADTGSPEFLADLPAATTSFDPPGLLGQGTIHYWRIDETQSAGPPIKGTIWSFTTYRIPGDMNEDGDVDHEDFGLLQACFSGSGYPYPPGCASADLDSDNDVDIIDANKFLLCVTGYNTWGDPHCAD